MNNYDIAERAIKRVMEHLEKQGLNPQRQKNGAGADIICGDMYIDVKGCLKTATNIRMHLQPLKKLKDSGKLKQGNFFIYYVFNIALGKPKMKIFDFNTFEKFKIKECVWALQPKDIQRKTGGPKTIDL